MLRGNRQSGELSLPVNYGVGSSGVVGVFSLTAAARSSVEPCSGCALPQIAVLINLKPFHSPLSASIDSWRLSVEVFKLAVISSIFF